MRPLLDQVNNQVLQLHPAFFSNFNAAKFKIVENSSLISMPKKDLLAYASINTLYNPEIIRFSSISDAAKKLKAKGRNWVNIASTLHRKTSLISEQLPKLRFRLINFPSHLPDSPLGHWSLLNENTLLCATACSAKTPNGIYNFIEDKINPPSRAYLKLWELFTYLGLTPSKDSLCLDLGASPGGWSWVLSKHAKKVFAIDKAELEFSQKLANVNFKQDDILKGRWETLLPEVDWVFCDAALDPEKIVPIFSNLMRKYPDKSFVCTLKQKGHNISSATQLALSSPQTRTLALSHNKHEFTWFKIAKGTFEMIYRATKN